VRLSVTTKIFLSLTGVLAAFAAVAIYSVLTFQVIGEQLEIVDEGYIPLTKIAAELEALESKTSFERIYPNSIAARVSLLIRRAEEIVAAALKRKHARAETAFFERARIQLIKVKEQHRKNVMELPALLAALASKRQSDLARVRQRFVDRESFIRAAVRSLSAELEGRITSTVLSVRREQRTSAWAVMALAVIAAAVGLMLVLYAQYTLRPIKRLTEGVVRVARGDYTGRVQISAKDEIGLLSTEFNRMAESLLERDRRLQEQQRELQVAYAALDSEKRFSENIVQSIRSAIVVTDLSGKVTALNKSARDLLGLEERAELGANERLSAVPDLLRRLEEALGGAEGGLEAVRLPDGRSLDLKILPFRDPVGTVQGAMLIADDVTERVRTKEELVKSERLAAVGRIAAQITHEIRNPLSSIGLNAELLGEEVARLSDGRDATEGRALVASISREVDRLTEVTEQYLRYARLPRPRLEPEEVNAILADLLNFMDGEFRERAIEVRRELDETVPAIVADENQLRQAFLNLLRNSCESMRGGGSLRVSTSRENGLVCITIADTGVGIDRKHLSRIFDPFFSTKEGGTGLGLALTHQIIEEHGGSIRCESELGRGTIFRVLLPTAKS
jgi:PAS domain S-box-containing protein